MKRTLLSLLALLATLTGTAQTIGEAFYVYRSNGMINTFFRSEVDSMAYSYYDIDSTYYDEVVTQVFYTPDSIYRIHLAEIDSISFVTPETKYQPGVVRLEGTIRDYIIGSDSLTVFFRTDTPSGILPRVGDKLVTTEMSDVFEIGFAGEVVEIERQTDQISIICTDVELSDVFETYYGFTGNNSASREAVENGRRKININESGSIVVPWGKHGFELPSSWWLTMKPFEGYNISGQRYFSFSFEPTTTIEGSIIVNKERGTFFSLSVTTDLKMDETTGFSIKASEERKFGIPLQTPPLAVMPFVRGMVEAGVFVKVQAEGSVEMALKQHYRHTTRFVYSSRDKSVRQAVCRLQPLENTFEGSAYIQGGIAGGVYLDLGFSFIDRRISKAYASIEAGFEAVAHGGAKITTADLNNAKTSTELYDRLHSSYLAINKFYGTSLKLDFLKFYTYEVKLPLESNERIATVSYVPTFNNVTLAPVCIENGSGISMAASSEVTDACMSPVKLGYALFDNEQKPIGKYDDPDSYRSGGRYLSYTFDGLKPNTNYLLHPTVIQNDIEMLASPSVNCCVDIRPITLDVSDDDITESMAIVWGKIEGHDLLDGTERFGIGYYEVGDEAATFIDASTIYFNSRFYVDLENLKPNTTYKYYTYLIIDGEAYCGEEKEFTTTGIEPYFVVSDYDLTTGFHTLTYYYDGMRKSRNGAKIEEDHIVSYHTRLVNFDSSFSNYYPKRFQFNYRYYTSILQRVENIRYLNTDSITDMSCMFSDCSSLTSLDLSSFNTSNVTDMYGMFSGCSSLTSLDVSGFNTSNVTNMSGMFSGCSSLTSLDLSNFNTSNVTYMPDMFSGCSSLTSLDLSSFNTSSVTNMKSMFYECSSLTSLDFRNLNTSSLAYYGDDRVSYHQIVSLFPRSLINLDLRNLVLTGVFGHNLFLGIVNIQQINLSNADTSNATNMDSMFFNCSSLTSLDLSSFNISNVTNMFDMFFGCSSLRTIYAGNWVNKNSDDTRFRSSMFDGCPNLVGGKGTKIGKNLYGYDKNGKPLYYYCSHYGTAAHIDGGKDNPGLFTSK